MRPFQFAFLPFFCVGYASFAVAFVLTLSVQLIFSILLQHDIKNFPGIFDLLSEYNIMVYAVQIIE